jgi:hypothetical protein
MNEHQVSQERQAAQEIRSQHIDEGSHHVLIRRSTAESLAMCKAFFSLTFNFSKNLPFCFWIASACSTFALLLWIHGLIRCVM